MSRSYNHVQQAMPHNYSVQVDNQLHAAIEEDRMALSMQMGTELTRSQYLRLVLNARLQLAEPLPVGYREGARLGFARIMRALQDVLAEEEAAAAAANG